ncbi:MAG: branched-chain amino acid ABC transporter permease [Burkholderiales bacterium]|nr:branched-chain amino acid ABC transporter permease [Burkholderiales bacterium]MCC7113308.1 branched-chain amino acid ABC transporter permease [Burkholderiales bacterium]
MPSSSRQPRLPRWFSLCVFLAFVAAFPATSPNAYLLNIIGFAGIHILLSIGLNILMGYAGQISLGHAAFWGLGAYISGVLTSKFGWPPVLGLAASVLGTCIAALAIALPTLRLKGHYLAMATLGVGIIVHTLFVQLSGLTGGPSGLVDVPSFSIGPITIGSAIGNYYFIWAWVAIGALASLNLRTSRIGRALNAIKGGDVAAECTGVDTYRYKVIVFVLSAAYAAVAGTLYVHYINFAAPDTFGFMQSVLILTMVVVGGIGTFWGPIIGGGILTFLPEYLRAYEGLDVVIYGTILVAVMMFMPNGLASLARDLSARFRTTPRV